MSLKSYVTDNKLIKYTRDHCLRLQPIQQELIDETFKHRGYRMLGSPEEIQLLMNLCKTIKAKKTLDVGVYTGYSALSIALVLPDDGKVVACDITDEYPSIGKPFWKKAGVAEKIDLRIGPAVDTLRHLVESGETGTFDFAFIDADKPGYDDYYELCLQLLRPGGIIAIDNVLWGGKVVDPEVMDDDTVALRAINVKVAKDERVDVNMLLVGDGTTLAFKR